MYWWARNYPVTDAAREAEVTEATACAVYQWLREVCSTRLLHTTIRLGGPGVVVQIDESLMNHKPKVNISWSRGGACSLLILLTIIGIVPSWAETSNGTVGLRHG